MDCSSGIYTADRTDEGSSSIATIVCKNKRVSTLAATVFRAIVGRVVLGLFASMMVRELNFTLEFRFDGSCAIWCYVIRKVRTFLMFFFFGSFHTVDVIKTIIGCKSSIPSEVLQSLCPISNVNYPPCHKAPLTFVIIGHKSTTPIIVPRE